MIHIHTIVCSVQIFCDNTGRQLVQAFQDTLSTEQARQAAYYSGAGRASMAIAYEHQSDTKTTCELSSLLAGEAVSVPQVPHETNSCTLR